MISCAVTWGSRKMLFLIIYFIYVPLIRAVFIYNYWNKPRFSGLYHYQHKSMYFLKSSGENDRVACIRLDLLQKTIILWTKYKQCLSEGMERDQKQAETGDEPTLERRELGMYFSLKLLPSPCGAEEVEQSYWYEE